MDKKVRTGKTRRKAVKRENETPEYRVLAVTSLERGGGGGDGKNLYLGKGKEDVESKSERVSGKFLQKSLLQDHHIQVFLTVNRCLYNLQYTTTGRRNVIANAPNSEKESVISFLIRSKISRVSNGSSMESSKSASEKLNIPVYH